MDSYLQMAREIRRSYHVVALTGAGLSTESGIPDFRSPGGMWTKYDPLEYGHIESFRREPEKVWKMLLEMENIFSAAKPNAAHYVLVELERRGKLKSIITQNVDGLHQRAGSRNVIEFHGQMRTLRCDDCMKSYPREAVSLVSLPPRCSACGGALRPDFVFFGESIPGRAHDQALVQTQDCDMMIVVGTSVTVAPASYLPYLAKVGGAYILEINTTHTDLSEKIADCCISEPAGEVLPAILKELDALVIPGKAIEQETQE